MKSKNETMATVKETMAEKRGGEQRQRRRARANRAAANRDLDMQRRHSRASGQGTRLGPAGLFMAKY